MAQHKNRGSIWSGTIGIRANGSQVWRLFMTAAEAETWIRQNWDMDGAWYAGTRTWQITRGLKILREVEIT